MQKLFYAQSIKNTNKPYLGQNLYYIIIRNKNYGYDKEQKNISKKYLTYMKWFCILVISRRN